MALKDEPSAEGQTVPRPDDEEDDDYNSEEDPDFDINKPIDDGSEDSSGDEEDDENTANVERPRKRQRIKEDDDTGVELAEPESGDEAIIQNAMKRKQKEGRRKDSKAKKQKRPKGREDEGASDYSDDDVGGEGGLIKTRAQKLREQHERKGPLTGQGKVTVDVDALWERLNAAPVHGPPLRREPEETDASAAQSRGDETSKETTTGPSVPPLNPITLPDEEKITIKRVYKFAGEVITEEHVVPRDSAEAKLYLSSADAAGAHLNEASEAGQKLEIRTNEAGEPLIRPSRRFSRFDPNPPEAYKRSWGHGLLASKEPTERENTTENAAAAAGANVSKLNTVEKSRLDWVTYVDKSGIKEDLDIHSRAKEGYMDRMEFLRRVDEKREEERREARLKRV